MRSIHGILAAISLLLTIGCSGELLWAVGQTEKVGLVTSFALQDNRVDEITSMLQAPVQMVRPESRFRVEPIPIDLFEANRDWKAIAVLTDLSAPGFLAEAVTHLISAEQRAAMAARDVDFRLIENAWAKGQCVLLVHAKSSLALSAFLEQSGTNLARNFDEALQVAIGPAVLAGGEDKNMEAYVRRNYGFDIGIPRGYMTGEDAEGRVVRLYRVISGEPARYVLIHWMPLSERPNSFGELLTLRNRLGETYYQGDHVLEERTEIREGTFQNEPAWVIQGVWQNDNFYIGGPFRTFAFERGDRYFLLDVAVYNPPGSKLPYLRETLAIARTFRMVGPT